MEVGPEVLEHVVDIALDHVLGVLDGTASRPRCADERFDLELVGVRQLVALAVEDLDPVVLGRIVRGRHDEAEVLREQRHRRSREHAREDGGAARIDDAPPKGRLEARAGRPRVAADEHAPASRPERRRTADLLDELLGERLVDDPPDAVRAEPPTGCRPHTSERLSRHGLGHPNTTLHSRSVRPRRTSRKRGSATAC